MQGVFGNSIRNHPVEESRTIGGSERRHDRSGGNNGGEGSSSKGGDGILQWIRVDSSSSIPTEYAEVVTGISGSGVKRDFGSSGNDGDGSTTFQDGKEYVTFRSRGYTGAPGSGFDGLRPRPLCNEGTEKTVLDRGRSLQRSMSMSWSGPTAGATGGGEIPSFEGSKGLRWNQFGEDFVDHSAHKSTSMTAKDSNILQGIGQYISLCDGDHAEVDSRRDPKLGGASRNSLGAHQAPVRGGESGVRGNKTADGSMHGCTGDNDPIYDHFDGGEPTPSVEGGPPVGSPI